jgi:hypothetical protein
MSRNYLAEARESKPAPDPLTGSTRDFLSGPNADLLAKTSGISAWLDARVAFGGFPFSNRLLEAPPAESSVRRLDG